MKKILLFSILLSSGAAFADVKDEIYDIAGQIQSSVYNTNLDQSSLAQIRRDLNGNLDALINGTSSGGDDVYCKRIRDSQYYAIARVSDQAWLEENGTEIDNCSARAHAARSGLVCAHIRDSEFYAPKLVSSDVWRGENGTDTGICIKQTSHARSNLFCQRIRDTDYYAIAKIDSGDWMQDNGTAIDECVRALGTFNERLEVAKPVKEPTVPSAAHSATR